MESDSSESVLTRALREGQGLGAQAAPDGAQVAQVAPADLNAAVGRRWKSKQAASRTRKARVCSDALQGIADRLGNERRTATQTETADNDGHVRQGFVRKIKAGSFTKKKMIEMALPQISREAPSSRLSLPNAIGHAGACGVRLKSIRRARELALNAITDQTECKLSQLAEASRNGMFMQEPEAFKISWDETALRFYCDPAQLKTLCESLAIEPRRIDVRWRPNPSRPASADAADEQTKTVRTGRTKPSYIVQVMQTSGHVRLGRRSGEYIIRPTLVSSVSANDLYCGIRPWMRSDLFSKSALHRGRQMMFLHGDSHPSNKLVISKVAAMTDEHVPIVDSPCLGHQLSLGCDDLLGAVKQELDVINPIFATQKLLQQLEPRNTLLRAVARLGREADVFRGVAPDPQFNEHARQVWLHSLGEKAGATLYAQRGPDRSDEFNATEQAIIDDFFTVFNGDWTKERWQHFCVRSASDRRPCCRNAAHSRERMTAAMKSVIQEIIISRLEDGTNKWAEHLRRCSHFSFPVHVHNTFPQATAAWLRRGDVDAGYSSDEHINDDFSVKKAKRKKKSVQFFKRRQTPSIMLSAGIIAVPLRRLLGKMFAVEKEARLRATLQEPADPGSGSLLGDFVKEGSGHFEQTETELENLLDDSSPLLKRMCEEIGAEAGAVIRRNRAMLLRAKGAYAWRIMRRVRRPIGFFAFVKTVDTGTAAASTGFCREFMKPSRKPCCLEPYFERRTQDLFKKLEKDFAQPPDVTMAPRSAFSKAIQWGASSPPVMTIVARETDHGNLSNKLKAKRLFTVGLRGLATDQMLERHLTQLPLRAAVVERMFDSRDSKRRRFNQNWHQPDALPQIRDTVTQALASSGRSRAPSKHPAGLYVLWRNHQVRLAQMARPGVWTAEDMVELHTALLAKWKGLPEASKTPAVVTTATRRQPAQARLTNM